MSDVVDPPCTRVSWLEGARDDEASDDDDEGSSTASLDPNRPIVDAAMVPSPHPPVKGPFTGNLGRWAKKSQLGVGANNK